MFGSIFCSRRASFRCLLSRLPAYVLRSVRAWPSFTTRRASMIYALLLKTNDLTRSNIAEAISKHDSQAIQPFVGKDIVHVMCAATAMDLFCIYCQDQVFPQKANPPKGHQARNQWYFQHRTNNKCINEIVKIGALSVINPPEQGCYVALGCETVQDRDRRSCQTIDQGRRTTYCHLGGTLSCVP
jgi:hypothetical protein